MFLQSFKDEQNIIHAGLILDCCSFECGNFKTTFGHLHLELFTASKSFVDTPKKTFNLATIWIDMTIWSIHDKMAQNNFNTFYTLSSI